MLKNYKELYKVAQDRANDTKIFLVSNIREKTENFSDYDGTSVISEYLSLNQQELIVESLRSNGFETLCFFDEMDFIKSFLNNNYYMDESKEKIVINTAQKGTSIGRKSLIPAFCDLYGVRHTNSNPYVVSLARNKYHCSCLLNSVGLPTTTDCLYMPNNGWLLNREPQVGTKVIVKLNYETSSIGLTSNNIFTYEKSKERFIRDIAKEFNQPVVVETFVEGYEVEVPIMIGEETEVVLPVGITVNEEKNLGSDILDYTIRRDLKFGFYNLRFFIMSYDSDETNTNSGDLVVATKTRAQNLHEDDTIIYKKNNSMIIKKIERVEKDNKEINVYVANVKNSEEGNTEKEYEKVDNKQIMGRFMFKNRGMGNMAVFIQSPLGKINLVLIVFCIFIIAKKMIEKSAENNNMDAAQSDTADVVDNKTLDESDIEESKTDDKN